MRVVTDSATGEPRDALAQEWAPALVRLLPGAVWQPLPNVPGEVVARAEAWGLNGFILTGGNDIGAVPVRDETEVRVLEYARQHSLPVFGVCRGLQLIVHHAGGRIARLPDRRHAGRKHPVELLVPLGGRGAGVVSVNSFHDNTVGALAELPSALEALAVADDGGVEAVRDRRSPVMAVMWHPERPGPSADFDAALFREFFQKHLHP